MAETALHASANLPKVPRYEPSSFITPLFITRLYYCITALLNFTFRQVILVLILIVTIFLLVVKVDYCSSSMFEHGFALCSVQGAPGRLGEQGTQGEYGPHGPLGPQGDKGRRGLEGEAGPDGPLGDRVRQIFNL